MNIWKIKKWESIYDLSNPNHRCGVHIRYDKGVDYDVRKACKEFLSWLRKENIFPKKVIINIKETEQIKAMDGEMVSGIFFAPYNKYQEPYISICTGDYYDLVFKRGKDNALASILGSIAHELTHYFQWINDLQLTKIGLERQATKYARSILKEYAETREHPDDKESIPSGVIMTKRRIKEILEEAITNSNITNAYMVYSGYYYNIIPLKASNSLFMAINEDDFVFDGFCISRFRDVEKLRIKNDKCDEIIKSEGLLKNLSIPKINLECWETVFEDLKIIDENIIVQYETVEGKDDQFTIGRIKRVYKSCIYMYHFDSDGKWESELYRIPYNHVTSVTFNSRYIRIFSKYISAPNT